MDTPNRMNPIYSGALMLIIFIAGVFIIGLSGLSSNAEVALAPSSYVNDEGTTKIVQGQPEYVNGKKVIYKNTKVIPITPK